MQLFIGLIIALRLVYQLRQAKIPVTIVYNKNDDRWNIKRAGKSIREGELINIGYRSAAVVVMGIQTSDSIIHRIAVWADQVSITEFSYLHCHMSFNQNKPMKIQPLTSLRRLKGVVASLNNMRKLTAMSSEPKS